MLATLRVPAFAAVTVLSLAGCANFDGFPTLASTNSDVTTSSIAAAPKVDPACTALSAQIEGLRKEGVADKIEKAATKKYKMTPTDLTKADQLTKVNADYQSKCSAAGLKPIVSASAAPQTTQNPAVAAAPAAAKAASTAAAATAAVKAQ